jgi:hypothetical protein
VVRGSSSTGGHASDVSDTDGKICCEYDASDAVDRIVEVTLEISPAMFR